MTNYEELLTAYEVDVEFPDVSGMEHLHMLMRRSEIEVGEPHLTGAQRQRLLKADKDLFRQAKRFYESIDRMADLASWRHNQNVTFAQWWWYLDIVARLPVFTELPTIPAQFQPAELSLGARA
ncbi:MAG TPA: hypothetical protein G4N98_00090 [Thermoflexia bacterium]|nr:hypothetical protein [Thermoflexia bacterium]